MRWIVCGMLLLVGSAVARAASVSETPSQASSTIEAQHDEDAVPEDEMTEEGDPEEQGDADVGQLDPSASQPDAPDAQAPAPADPQDVIPPQQEQSY